MSLQKPFVLTSLFISLAVAAGGCTSEDFPLGGTYTVSPTSVDFGSVIVGEGAFADIRVENNDERELVFDVVRESGASAIKAVPERLTLPARSASMFSLLFEPVSAGDFDGAFDLVPTVDLAPTRIVAHGAAREPEDPSEICPPTITPTALMFGNVALNSEDRLEVRVDNCDDEPLELAFEANANARLCSSASDPSTFCVDLPTVPLVVPANGQIVFDVVFTPVIAGSRERGSFTLSYCDSPACETEVRLDGLGVETGLRCSPSTLEFGEVSLGRCVARTLGCENIANVPVTITQWSTVTWGGLPSSPDFEVEPSRPTTLEEGDAVDIEVTYCPSLLDRAVGTLGIETNLTDVRLRTVFVPLAGIGGGPHVDVSPAGCLDFGLVSTLVPSRRPLLVTSTGFSPAEITGFVVDTQQTGAFSAPGAQAAVLRPGEALAVFVEFSPPRAGPYRSGVVIQTNDVDQPEIEICLTGEGIVLPPCAYEVAPAALEMGKRPLLHAFEHSFEFRNVGQDDCLLSSVSLEPGSDLEFDLASGPVTSEIVPGGQARAITVGFTPTTFGAFTGTLELSVSSPTSPYVRVPVSGTGAELGVFVAPSRIEFGRTENGCTTRTRSIRLHNLGAMNASIDTVTLAPASNAFTLLTPTLPATIAPGDSIEVDVTFHPSGASDYATGVRITGTDDTGTFQRFASLAGEGGSAPQVDTFELLARAKADVLFVVDHSCSQSNERIPMGQNFPAFLQFASDQAIDYQIGVTTAAITSEIGRLIHPSANDLFGASPQRKIITPSSLPNPTALFEAAMGIPDLASGAPADESGLHASFLALSTPTIVGHNAGFVRSDASLSVIYMSDEEDQSPHDVDVYVDFLQSLKGTDRSAVAASAIVGPAPSGCSGPGGSAQYAPRYIEATRRTGGVLQSVCPTSWSDVMTELAPRAFGYATVFALTSQPIISTLEVTIDGVVVPATSPSGTTSWTYDFTRNAVVLTPLSPASPGSDVTVRYTPECL